MVKQEKNYNLKKRLNSNGFTLIELLVVIFIMALISGSVMVGSWRGQNQYAVSRAVQKMSADLHRVQSMALAGKTQGAITPSGYGLYSQSASQYQLFYNTGASQVYDGSSVVMETVTLAKAALAPVGSNIFFTPPNPTTYINGGLGGSQTFTIISGGYAKNVTVFSGGRIEID